MKNVDKNRRKSTLVEQEKLSIIARLEQKHKNLPEQTTSAPIHPL